MPDGDVQRGAAGKREHRGKKPEIEVRRHAETAPQQHVHPGEPGEVVEQDDDLDGERHTHERERWRRPASSSGVCGFCQRTLPPQYQGFQNGSCPYSTAALNTAPC